MDMARSFAAMPLALALASPPILATEAEEPVRLDTVTVTGAESSGYRATSASVSGFDEAPLLETPASISVIGSERLADQQARLLSDVLRGDASVGDAYAPLGYYENFNIRGFSLNSASSYKINGRTITGEQNVALENKEQVEVLKGLAGLQSGVADPGGLVNYVTKRPADIRSVTVATNEHGERYLAVDAGAWLNNERSFGLRVNAAHEDSRPYVEHADGRRDFFALAGDWEITPRALLQLDVEYQQKAQRSVPGYQLLGGSQGSVPQGASRRRLLGYQAWADPVSIDSLNLVGRFEYRFSDSWSAELSASRSRVDIDDNSAFPYGFAANGDYDIYDFRNDDVRRNDELQALLKGRLDTGSLDHQLTLGISYLKRVRDNNDGVNEWVGTGNIHSGSVPAYAQSSLGEGQSYRSLDSRQLGLFATDRIALNERWQVILGGRQVRLNERTYAADGDSTRHTSRSLLLPNVALVYQPQPDLALYTRYSEGLSLGGTAYWPASNQGEVLAPTRSRQVEVGAKYDWRRLSLTAALFRIRQDYQFNQPDGTGGFTFVQRGQQENTGIELGATGWVTERLNLAASVAAIRARVEGTGTPAYEDHQAINVPRLRASLDADYAIPGLNGLAILGGAQYSARKTVDREGAVSVPSYVVVDLGARYTTRIEGYDTTFRLTVDNLFDKNYWRDVSEYYGDGYLFLGAPRTARLAATINF